MVTLDHQLDTLNGFASSPYSAVAGNERDWRGKQLLELRPGKRQ